MRVSIPFEAKRGQNELTSAIALSCQWLLFRRGVGGLEEGEGGEEEDKVEEGRQAHEEPALVSSGHLERQLLSFQVQEVIMLFCDNGTK